MESSLYVLHVSVLETPCGCYHLQEDVPQSPRLISQVILVCQSYSTMIVLNSKPVSCFDGEAGGMIQGPVASFMLESLLDLETISTAEGIVGFVVRIEVSDFFDVMKVLELDSGSRKGFYQHLVHMMLLY